MQYNIPIRVLYYKSFNIHTITSLISIQEEKWKIAQKRNILTSYVKLSGESIIQSPPKKLTFTGSSAISFSIKSICMPDPKFTVLTFILSLCQLLTGCCSNSFLGHLWEKYQLFIFLSYGFYCLFISIVNQLCIKLGFGQQPVET